MQNSRLILRCFLLCLGAVLAACTFHEEVAPLAGGEKVPVLFTSGLGTIPTKVHGELGNQWGATDTLGVYMVEDGGNLSQVVDGAANIPYHATDVNVNRSSLLPAAADTVFYPATGEVNFILYYPYTHAVSGANYPVDLRDQSHPEAVDLMYANDGTAYDKSTTGRVNVVLRHQLSKLVFRIGKGAGLSSLADLTLAIEGVATQTTFDLSDGVLADPGLGGQETLSALVSPLANDSVKAEAIVLPVADLESTLLLLRIRADGQDYAATLPSPFGGPGLMSGYLYIYTVLLGENGGISLSGELTPWNDVAGGDIHFETGPPVSPIRIAMSAKIPHGAFLMGSPTDEPGRLNNEMRHLVTLTKDFYMSRYAITNAQYAQFLNANNVEGIETDEGGEIKVHGEMPVAGFGNQILVMENDTMGVEWNVNRWQPAAGLDTYPVVSVTWYGAKAFADWAGMSLPTDAQWEYACRAGETTAWYFGADGDELTGYAWYEENSTRKTHPVGKKKANAWGLHDMYGNVWEWCNDWYVADLTAADAVNPNISDATSGKRIKRGGCAVSLRATCRSAKRSSDTPDFYHELYGFRVAWVVP